MVDIVITFVKNWDRIDFMSLRKIDALAEVAFKRVVHFSDNYQT